LFSPLSGVSRPGDLLVPPGLILICGQSICGASSLKIMFLHFLIRKSGNDGRIRRSVANFVVETSPGGVLAAGEEPMSGELKVKLEKRRILYKNTVTCLSIQ
jgi:hypothetical protein